MLLLVALVWLPGSREVRRAGAIVAIVVLTAVTTVVVLRAREDQPVATPSALASQGGTPSASVVPGSPSTSGAPGPSASPTVLRHEVGLQAGSYSIFTVDPAGVITGEQAISFGEPSRAPVDRVESPNGLVHWRTVGGGYTGWSYIAGRSGPITVREVLRWPDGEIGYREVDPGS